MKGVRIIKDFHKDVILVNIDITIKEVGVNMAQQLPKENKFDGLDERLMKRVRKDYDAVICFSGGEGDGKSNNANELCFAVDDGFKMSKNILFQPDAQGMKDAIEGLPKYSAINADEAVRILYKQRRFDQLQIYINTLFQLCRQENKIVVLCIPRFTDLNEYFRNHRVKIWIHCYARGYGILYMKDVSPRCSDPWHMKDGYKIEKKYMGKRQLYDLSPSEVHKVMRNVPCYQGIIEFKKNSPEVDKEYKMLKKEHSYSDLDTEFGMGMMNDKWRLRFTRLAIFCNRALGMSNNDVGQVSGVSKDLISAETKKLAITKDSNRTDNIDITALYIVIKDKVFKNLIKSKNKTLTALRGLGENYDDNF